MKYHNNCIFYSSLLFAVLFLITAEAFTADLLHTNPAPLQAGEYADITFRVSHELGSELPTMVQFGLEDTSFMRVMSQANFSIINFPRSTSMTRTFRIHIHESTPTGFLEIPFYIYQQRSRIKIPVEVFVEQKKQPPLFHVGSVGSVPRELLPDTERNRVKVTVLNMGEYDALQVRAELRINRAYGRPSFSYSLEDSVAIIHARNQHTFDFYVDLEDVREPFNAEVVLSSAYESVHTNRIIPLETTLPVMIEIVEAPFLRVQDVNQESNFAVGSSENTVSLVVKNEGKGRAENVRVRLAPDVSFPLRFQSLTQYVAPSIQPGEEVTIQFSAEVLRNAKVRDYPIKLVFESMTGETRYTREDVISISVADSSRPDTRQVGIGIIGLVIILGIVFGIFGRKRKD